MISGNSRVVRNINRAMLLNLIRTRQPISRAKLAKITGLNKSTVSSIVADLLKEEIIDEQLVEDQNIGRNPYDLTLKTGKHLVGAINIDFPLTRFAIFDIDGSILHTSELKTKPDDPVAFIESCLRELKKLAEKNKLSLWGLGVSIAGIVDPYKLIVKYAPNLGWQEIKIGAIIKKSWPELKAFSMGNDAKASALAEQWFGSHNTILNNFVFLSVGNGLGTGIVVDNKLLEGETHASGEFGHMVLFEGGELCSCGNKGCWETYASDRGTIKRFCKEAGINENDPEDETMDRIVCLANENNSHARDVISKTGYFLGLGITNIIKSIDPNAIILGGKIIQSWDIIYPEIMKVVKERAFLSYMEKNIHILPTTLNVRPNLIGAATLAVKVLFDDYKIIV